MLQTYGLKIIDRVVIKELALTFLLALGVMTSALFIQQTLRFSDLFLETGISFFLFLQFLFYVLPVFLVLTVPIASLIASLLTFSRMNADREYTALQAAGVHPYRLLVPVSLFALAIAGLGLWMSLIVQPRMGEALQKQFSAALKQQHELGLQEGVFNIFFDRVIFIHKITPPSHLEGVLISDLSISSAPDKGTGEESQIVTAQSGDLLRDTRTSAVFLRLQNGSIHRRSGQEDYQILRFAAYTLRLGVDDPLQRGSGFLKAQWSLDLPAFQSRLSDLLRKEGNSEHYRALAFEYHKKMSLPAAALFLGLLGAPLGIFIRTTTRWAGFAFSILILLGYYLLLIVAEFLNGTGYLTPFLAAWMPNAAAALTAAVMIRMVGRR